MGFENALPLVDKLRTMSADEIHDLMVSEGIKGDRLDSRTCPISNFIRGKCDGTSVSTSPRTILVQDDSPLRELFVALPPDSGPAGFIRAFDEERYPDLIRERVWA